MNHNHYIEEGEKYMSVTIYTTPSCGYCRMAKEWFRQNGISFTEYNVAADMRSAEEMFRKSGQMGVPVIDIDGRIIIGFNKTEIEKSLNH
ncbi:MAG TPA: glutaredoxin domain-containing protein [Rectinema sp.]|jgi:glutaredoxin-like YruB-family protein|nr:glutaredoxin domain-containing protein [Rectinema sp.]HOW11276.1 glutaredoxin domain-containing protein [Rectinema sp.]